MNAFCSLSSVPENLTIYDLRRYITDVCSEDQHFPTEFVYLRSVGQYLAQVNLHQEKELRVKNYRPPMVSKYLNSLMHNT